MNSMCFPNDVGRLLENMVFIHLKRLGKKVYYFRQTGECDFIVSQDRRVEMITQVCYELNTDNLSREMNGLTEAMNELKFKEGYIFTFNQENQIQKDGKTIHVVPVWKWMYQK